MQLFVQQFIICQIDASVRNSSEIQVKNDVFQNFLLINNKLGFFTFRRTNYLDTSILLKIFENLNLFHLL
jgi:hypothetical protein